jgi:peptide deformylase
MSNTQAKKLNLVPPTDPVLNMRAREVDSDEVTSPETRVIIDRMINLAAGKGHDKEDTRQMVGLAAPQLGVSKRIIAIDLTADGSNKEQTLRVFINPRITEYSKELVPGREGCWSCGDICGNVERAENVVLEGIDRDGKPMKYDLAGFVARIAQLEVDHLDGIRFPDRIPFDKPECLHLVKPAEFEEYRKEWMHWAKFCPRETWNAMKDGS